jgi:tricarballylate dehydrogenase
MSRTWDVVVAGGGNAALCAALAARDTGATVLVLERAPYEHRGGNTAFTAGVMRTTYEDVGDLLQLSPGLSREELEQADFGSYPVDRFLDDLARMTEHRTDPDLAEALARRSFDTLRWMTTKGVRFMPGYSQQLFRQHGRYVFPDGLTMEVSGGGAGLVDALSAACSQAGVEIRYGAAARSLTTDPAGRVVGLTARLDGRDEAVDAGAVVLGCGGFGANTQWRARYLGPGWDLARVRGSRYSTGDGLQMALDVGAMPFGHWSGVHATAWELNAPATGDRNHSPGFHKTGYPFGIMVNARGERFFDEGAHYRSHTAAQGGPAILQQPAQLAWQVFDSKVTHLLGEEYRIREVTRVRAESIEQLAQRLDGVDADGFLRTVGTFNSAVRTDVTFDPNRLDGRGTTGLPVPKSNWATTIDSPPFEAYAVTCGVTFTFGGVRIDTDGRVLDAEEAPIPGLYACGEMVGGLFYHNYVDGAGLASGAVFGRAAGKAAARLATGTTS